MAEPLLEQRAVEASEVGGFLQISERVEPGREAHPFADHRTGSVGADHEPEAGGAVVGAGGGVLQRPAAELRPHDGQHAIVETARLEVALEGEEGLSDLGE